MKNTTKTILLSILIILFCSGCDLFQKNNDHLMTNNSTLDITEDINKTMKTIDEETKKIDEKTESISENAQEIYDAVVIIQPKLPEESKKEINPQPPAARRPPLLPVKKNNTIKAPQPTTHPAIIHCNVLCN